MNDAFTILTPYGTLQATFPEDGGCNLAGPDDARTFFEDQANSTVGPMGQTLSITGMEPAHLMGFMDRPDLGIRVIPPLDWDDSDDAS